MCNTKDAAATAGFLSLAAGIVGSIGLGFLTIFDTGTSLPGKIFLVAHWSLNVLASFGLIAGIAACCCMGCMGLRKGCLIFTTIGTALVMLPFLGITALGTYDTFRADWSWCSAKGNSTTPITMTVNGVKQTSQSTGSWSVNFCPSHATASGSATILAGAGLLVGMLLICIIPQGCCACAYWKASKQTAGSDSSKAEEENELIKAPVGRQRRSRRNRKSLKEAEEAESSNESDGGYAGDLNGSMK